MDVIAAYAAGLEGGLDVLGDLGPTPRPIGLDRGQVVVEPPPRPPRR